MSVCLHCGEIGGEGALFCAKCGYTLPQDDPHRSPGPTVPAGVPAGPPLPPSPPSGAYRAGFSSPPSASLGPVPVAGPAGAPPTPAPPSAKYCVRCATLISRVAVYCPVCQQPQP